MEAEITIDIIEDSDTCDSDYEYLSSLVINALHGNTKIMSMNLTKEKTSNGTYMTTAVNTLFAPGTFEAFLVDIESSQSSSFYFSDGNECVCFEYDAVQNLLIWRFGFEDNEIAINLVLSPELKEDLYSVCKVINEYYA